MFVDLTAEVDGSLSVSESSVLEGEIEGTLRRARREIVGVQVRFRAVKRQIVVVNIIFSLWPRCRGRDRG
jgi:hypothetical protein